MTQATRQRLSRELEEVAEVLRVAMLSIGGTGGTSDWHENFAYEQAHRDVEFHSIRLRMLEKRLTDVELIQPRTNIDDIGIGNSVMVQFSDMEEPEVFTILGEADSGTKEGWISYLSPLGRNLIGRMKGDSVNLSVKNNNIVVRIVDVFPGDFE